MPSIMPNEVELERKVNAHFRRVAGAYESVEVFDKCLFAKAVASNDLSITQETASNDAFDTCSFMNKAAKKYNNVEIPFKY